MLTNWELAADLLKIASMVAGQPSLTAGSLYAHVGALGNLEVNLHRIDDAEAVLAIEQRLDDSKRTVHEADCGLVRTVSGRIEGIEVTVYHDCDLPAPTFS